MATLTRTALLRDRSGPQRVTFLELFFDLVYVFAVTQLSHGLLEHLSWSGAFETLILTWAVWMAWIYTTWITNWFDPDRLIVKLVILGVMFSSLVMSAALPEAFGSRGLMFALAYLTIQIGRTLFTIWALRGHPLRRNFERVVAWFALSSIPWIAGALADDGWRVALWTLALGLEVTAGILRFYVPGLGRTRTTEWTISAEHFLERCQLFVIIALGESIILTGATFADGEITTRTAAAFVVAFLGSVAYWWIYHLSAIRLEAAEAIERDVGGFARTISYILVVLIFGIIVSAVGDELVIAHPSGHTETAWRLVIFGGPALFIAGDLLVFAAAMGRVVWSGVVGLVALGVLALAMGEASPLVAATAAMAVLVGIAAWETARDWEQLARRLEGAPVTGD